MYRHLHQMFHCDREMFVCDSGTGDIAVDMENQVKANSLRIHVLEEQNATLRKTITKMLQAQGSPNDTAEVRPIC